MVDVVISSGRHFEADQQETILDAALRHGVVLEYSCRTGRCGTCRARIRDGVTVPVQDEVALAPDEKDGGWILTCVRRASSDIALEVEDLSGLKLQAARTLPCRIQSLSRLAPDVLRAVLRLPPGSAFVYQPGQYIDVIGPGGTKRSYSIANAPSTTGHLELHVRQFEGGAMSSYWFGKAGASDLLRLRGPMGTCFLRDTAGRDLVFLATGTGIAPVKAMLEGLAVADPQSLPRSIRLYWGGRVPQDIYWHPDEGGAKCLFFPVLSRADEHWTGARGHVQDVFLQSGPDMAQTVIYACGSDAMIRSARRELLGAGLPERRFHSDAFVASGVSSESSGARS